MDRLQQAVARVRSLLVPATQFTSGIKVYEPEHDDPQAPLKRDVLGFATRAIDIFGSDSMPARLETTALRTKANEYRAQVASDIAEPEKQDYFRLLTALDQLFAVGERQ